MDERQISADRLIDLASVAESNETLRALRRPAVAIPSGYKLVGVSDREGQPARVIQSVETFTLGSFLQLWERFKVEGHSVITVAPNSSAGCFADVMAIFDYHPGPSDARWCSNVATLQLKASPNYRAWMAHNNQAQTQTNYLEFLTDHMEDVVKPSGAELLEIVRHFHGKKNITFQSAQHLGSGAVELKYKEDVEGGGANKKQMPEKIQIGLEPYIGCPKRYAVDAEVRYRINDGRLTMLHRIPRVEDLEEKILDDLVEHIAKESGAPVLRADLSDAIGGRQEETSD